jgi:hypothetical protein
MSAVVWIRLLNEGIPLILLIGMGAVLYRGIKRNQILLSEREDLLRRYLIFRGDKQARLKIHGGEEQVRHELLKNLSSSWKEFKKSYDEYHRVFSKNTARTKVILQLIALGLLINTARVLVDEYYFFGFKARFFTLVARELSNYVLVVLSFVLLRAQTHHFLSFKGKALEVERETLFFGDGVLAEGEYESLYNEFDPLDREGTKDGKEDQDPRGPGGGGSRAE